MRRDSVWSLSNTTQLPTIAPSGARGSASETLDRAVASKWQKLLELEVAAFAARAAGRIDKRTVSRLRRALHAVASLPDVECAIYYHSAWALVHEFDGRLADAIRHRVAEIAKIRRLHTLVRRHPTSKWVLRGRGLRFLASRQRVLAQLRAASKPRSRKVRWPSDKTQ